jgi:Na+-translocating ferredoxin:NAD+ oxidoreductase RnfG subunit
MRKLLAALGLAAALGGCGLSVQSPGEVEDAAKAVYAKIEAGDLAGLKAMSAPDLQAQETQALVDQMRAEIPKEKPTKDETTFWRVNANVGAPAQASVRRTYTYPSGAVQFDVVLQKPGGAKTWAVTGVHVLRSQQTPGAGQ